MDRDEGVGLQARNIINKGIVAEISVLTKEAFCGHNSSLKKAQPNNISIPGNLLGMWIFRLHLTPRE